MSTLRFLAEYAPSGATLAATISDTSVSTSATPSAGLLGARSLSDTSLSTEKTNIARRLTASDTSASTEHAVANITGRRTASDTSASTDSTTRGPFAGARTASDTSTSADSPTALGTRFATVSDTSSSTEDASPAPFGFRVISDTSLSTATLIINLRIALTAVDTSTSVDQAPSGVGPYAVKETSLSTDTASAATTRAITLSDESDSVDQTPVGAQAGTATDTSTSSDTTPIAALTGQRATTDTSTSSDRIISRLGLVTRSATDTSVSSDTFRATHRARTTASDSSTSTATLSVQWQAIGFQIHVRERAPLRLTVTITTPAGFTQRWAADEANPENVPTGLEISSVIPGGFEQGSCALARQVSRDYPDLERYADVTVQGVGGMVAHQGRLDSFPDTAGDNSSVTPTWVGYQQHLQDDQTAREIFVDRNIGNWQGPSVKRQIQWLQAAGGAVIANGPSVGPDSWVTSGGVIGGTSLPSLVAELSGSWTESQIIEGWYDARGIPIGRLYAAWQTNGMYTLGAGGFGAAMFLATEDAGINYDRSPAGTGSLAGAAGSATLLASAARPWGILQLWNTTVPGGKDGASFQLFWTALGVYGRHGLPLYGTADAGNAQGVIASDAVAYALNKWAPEIAYSTGPNGSIQPSTFVIPQLTFLDPSTVAAMLAEASKYELLDWAVWEGPTFYMNPRGGRGRKWRARSGPAQLQETGPQGSRLYNGVIVQWPDVSGINRTVGPPGSGANYEDATLLDSDPLNPANQVHTQAGTLRKWGLLQMGTSTLSGATKIGQVFLAQQKLLDTSGQAQLVGHAQDENGIYWPAWMVRGGDQISFVDASDPSYRRIVHSAYSDSTKGAQVQLDQPPDSLQALLERLSVVLQPYGLS